MPEVHSASYFQTVKINDRFLTNRKINAARRSYCGALLKATAETVVSAIVWPLAVIAGRYRQVNGRIKFSAKAMSIAFSGIRNPRLAHDKVAELIRDKYFPVQLRKIFAAGRNAYISDKLKARLSPCNIPDERIKETAMDLLKSTYAETLTTRRHFAFLIEPAKIDETVVILVREHFDRFLQEIGGGEEYDCLAEAKASFEEQLRTEDPVATLQKWTSDGTRKTWLEAMRLGNLKTT